MNLTLMEQILDQVVGISACPWGLETATLVAARSRLPTAPRRLDLRVPPSPLIAAPRPVAIRVPPSPLFAAPRPTDLRVPSPWRSAEGPSRPASAPPCDDSPTVTERNVSRSRLCVTRALCAMSRVVTGPGFNSISPDRSSRVEHITDLILSSNRGSLSSVRIKSERRVG